MRQFVRNVLIMLWMVKLLWSLLINRSWRSWRMTKHQRLSTKELPYLTAVFRTNQKSRQALERCPYRTLPVYRPSLCPKHLLPLQLSREVTSPLLIGQWDLRHRLPLLTHHVHKTSPGTCSPLSWKPQSPRLKSLFVHRTRIPAMNQPVRSRIICRCRDRKCCSSKRKMSLRILSGPFLRNMDLYYDLLLCRIKSKSIF